jgi:hypothetical protein
MFALAMAAFVDDSLVFLTRLRRWRRVFAITPAMASGTSRLVVVMIKSPRMFVMVTLVSVRLVSRAVTAVTVTRTLPMMRNPRR